MTRNSLDDLFITYHIFIIYIEFLQKRTNDELMIIQKEYLKNSTTKLSVNDQLELLAQSNYHVGSTQKFYTILSEIKKEISDFYNLNQKSLPLYSISSYKKTLHTHTQKLLEILAALPKY